MHVCQVHEEVKKVQRDITNGMKMWDDEEQPEFMRADSAKPLFENANKVISRALNTKCGHVTDALSQVADLYVMVGDFENAQPLMRQVTTMLKKVEGPDSDKYVQYLHFYARSAEECDAVDAAEEALNLVVDVVKAKGMEGTPDHAMCLNQIASMLQRNDSQKKAGKYRAMATKIMEGSVGKDHPLFLQSLSQAASQHEQAEEFDQASEKFQAVLDALDEHETKLNEEAQPMPQGFLHMKAVSMLNLSHCYCSMNKSKKLKMKGNAKFKQAKDLCQKSVEIMEQLTPTERGEEYISVLRTMADIHFNLKEWDATEELFDKVLNLVLTSKGDDSMHYAFTMGDKAMVLKEQKKVDEAAEAFRAAGTAVNKAHKGKGNMHFVSFTTHEGLMMQENERYDEALKALQLAMDTVSKTFGPWHPDTALACQKVAKCYQDMKEFDKAEPLFRQAVEVLAKTNIPQLLLPAFQAMGDCFEAAGQKDKAKQMFEHMKQLQLQMQMQQMGMGGPGAKTGGPGATPVKRAFGQNRKGPSPSAKQAPNPKKKGGQKKKA